MKRAVFVATALLIGACSSGGDDGGRPSEISDFAKEVAVQIQEGEDDDLELQLVTTEAECVAQLTVDELGEDVARDLELDSNPDPDFSEITSEQAAAIAGAYSICVDGFEERARSAFGEGLKQDDSFPVDDEEAVCMVDTIFDGLSFTDFIAASLQSEDDEFPEELAGPFVSALTTCLDLRSIFFEQFQDQGVPVEQSQCIVDALSDEDINEFFASTFAGGTDTDQEAMFERVLGPAVAGCA